MHSSNSIERMSLKLFLVVFVVSAGVLIVHKVKHTALGPPPLLPLPPLVSPPSPTPSPQPHPLPT